MKYNINSGIKHVKRKVTSLSLGLMAVVFPTVMFLSSGGASAASQVVVTPPVNSQGWSTNDTNADGSISFITDSTAPGNPNNGALQLTTDASTAAKAQYYHGTTTALSNVSELSYYTKQNSASFVGGDPAYQLVAYLNGGTSGYTTLTYEPYQGGQGAVVPGTWQQWNIDSTGLFWSSHTVNCSGGVVVGSSGGPAIYTLSALQSMCPNAVVAAFGVNIGSNNPSYNVEADLVDFNGTVYNFEPYQAATTKDQCKDGGWQNYTDSSGNHFKNQGDCVSYVATGGKNMASTH